MDYEKDGMEAIFLGNDNTLSFGLRIQGFEINYDLLWEGYTGWYFYSCGNEGADFTKVIDTCPISMTDVYKKKRR